MNVGRRRSVVSRLSRTALAAVALALLTANAAHAQPAQRLSITTGGLGGVYLPLGESMAQVLSRYIPGLRATAEVTRGSVENLKLIGAGKAEVGFAMVDAAWQAANGLEPFGKGRVDVRTLMLLYPNRMQIVTVDGTGIARLADLKGKRVSTGAPGSGVELMALRVLEAIGLDARNDITQQHLGAVESVNAIRDRKIDAFFWVGGVPTAAITDLARTPGTKVRLIDHAEALDAMNRKYGPLYVKAVIPPSAYPGMEGPVEGIDVWNILVASDRMSDRMAYDIVKTLMERKPELVSVRREATDIDLRFQAIGSPIPYHPGARKYFEERGLRFAD
jgi:uncharacterized protein